MTLATRAWLSLVALAIVMGAILFVPAGTIDYWQAWLYLVVFAIVRHPMYASALLYLAGTPPALGSYCGLPAFVAFVPVLIWRLLDEERLLVRKLSGYQEYQRRVPYRLVPHVW